MVTALNIPPCIVHLKHPAPHLWPTIFINTNGREEILLYRNCSILLSSDRKTRYSLLLDHTIVCDQL